LQSDKKLSDSPEMASRRWLSNLCSVVLVMISRTQLFQAKGLPDIFESNNNLFDGVG
jgi:hypothetical protein